MRYLRGNKSVELPRHHLIVDTESKRTPIYGPNNLHVHRLRLWCATSVDNERNGGTHMRHHSGESADSFWDLVYSLVGPKKNLWLWAHNMGWDAMQLELWKEIAEGRLLLDEPEHGWTKRKPRKPDSPPWHGIVNLSKACFLVTARTCEGWGVTIISSTNYFPGSLADIGLMLGVPKGRVDFDGAGDDELTAYCQQDVRILTEAVLWYLSLVRSHDLGMLRYTLSSQALTAYRHRFLKKPILLHDIAAARRLERAAHTVGECRAYYVGKVGGPWQETNDHVDHLVEQYWQIPNGPIYTLDVSSLYPAMMKGWRFPCKLEEHAILKDGDTWPKLVDPSRTIATVLLETPDDCYPKRVDGRSSWATGRYWTTLSGPELFAAVNNELVVAVKELLVYETAYLFDKFVDELWHCRQQYQQSDVPIAASIMKGIMNGLYGKFAQHASSWVRFPEADGTEPWGEYLWNVPGQDRNDTVRFISWRAEKKGADREHPMSFPAISAFVTSYGRMHMNYLRKVAGPRNVFYQGVDSLHVNRTGFDSLRREQLIQDNRLGFLRLTGVHNKAFYWGPMDYMLGDTIHRPGWKKRGKPAGPDSWQQEEFQSSESIIRHPPDGTCKQWVRTLTHDRPYLHGNLGVDGWLIPTHFRSDTEWQ